jgi:hypothetical protein
MFHQRSVGEAKRRAWSAPLKEIEWELRRGSRQEKCWHRPPNGWVCIMPPVTPLVGDIGTASAATVGVATSMVVSVLADTPSSPAGVATRRLGCIGGRRLKYDDQNRMTDGGAYDSRCRHCEGCNIPFSGTMCWKLNKWLDFGDHDPPQLSLPRVSVLIPSAGSFAFDADM